MLDAAAAAFCGAHVPRRGAGDARQCDGGLDLSTAFPTSPATRAAVAAAAAVAFSVAALSTHATSRPRFGPGMPRRAARHTQLRDGGVGLSARLPAVRPAPFCCAAALVACGRRDSPSAAGLIPTVATAVTGAVAAAVGAASVAATSIFAATHFAAAVFAAALSAAGALAASRCGPAQVASVFAR